MSTSVSCSPMTEISQVLTFCLCPPPSSCDQALLWLPAATEAPNASHLPAPAAGHHVGRTQTQDLQFLAQYRTLDTVQKMKDSVHLRLCLNSCFYPSVTFIFIVLLRKHFMGWLQSWHRSQTLWNLVGGHSCYVTINIERDSYYCSTAPLSGTNTTTAASHRMDTLHRKSPAWREDFFLCWLIYLQVFNVSQLSTVPNY